VEQEEKEEVEVIVGAVVASAVVAVTVAVAVVAVDEAVDADAVTTTRNGFLSPSSVAW